MTRYTSVLPWQRWFQRRCPARLHRGADPAFFGRCELRRDHGPIEHALERGMVVLRWSVAVRWEEADCHPVPDN